MEIRTKLKKGLSIATLLLCLTALAGLRSTITLYWDYPPALLSPDLTFKIYSSTDMINWVNFTNVVGTNTEITIPITASRMFFTATASNFWGESDFSNTASTPNAPLGGFPLHIK